MSKAIEAVPAGGRVEFAVDRFALVEGERLDVHGTWSGVRGRRFMRPALSLQLKGERVRLLADLAHKPWAAEEAAPWFASFPCTIQADEVLEAELTVAPDLTVELPSPITTTAGDASPVRTGTDDESAPPPAADPAPAPSGSGPTSVDLEQLRQERDQAVKEASRARIARERAMADLSAAERARQDADAKRSSALADRDTAIAERQTALAERDQARSERDAMKAERDRALAGHAEAIAERDSAIAARDQALEQRDNAVEARDTALVARDLALTERGALVDAVKRFEAEARAAPQSPPEQVSTAMRTPSRTPSRIPSRAVHLTPRRVFFDAGDLPSPLVIQRTVAVAVLLTLAIVLLVVLRVL